jgi:hypothetical protein
VFIGNCTVALESRAYHCYREGDCSYARKEKDKTCAITGCSDFDLFLIIFQTGNGCKMFF